MLKDGLMYQRAIELNSKATTIRIVVRDWNSANIGSLTIPIKQITQTPWSVTSTASAASSIDPYIPEPD